MLAYIEITLGTVLSSVTDNRAFLTFATQTIGVENIDHHIETYNKIGTDE